MGRCITRAALQTAADGGAGARGGLGSASWQRHSPPSTIVPRVLCCACCRGLVHRDLKLETLLRVKKKDISHIKIAGADSSFTAAQLLA